MPKLSLKWITLLLGLFVACGMAALVVVGSITATESVTDVAEELRDVLGLRAVADINSFLLLPTRFNNRVLGMSDARAYNFQRADAAGIPTMLAQWSAQYAADTGFDGSVYLANELGHIVGLMALGPKNSTFYTTTSPPLDQIIEGNPAWTIPCRYNASCDNSTGRCVAPNHWGDAEPPFWAAGRGTYAGAAAMDAYQDGHAYVPEYARWAAARTAASASACRGLEDTVGAKPPCLDNACPEFNRTYYYTNMLVTTQEYVKSRYNYDPRSRGWYKQQLTMPPAATHIDMVLCSSGFPCLSSMRQWRELRPAVGAAVEAHAGAGVVVGHAHTPLELHSPVIEFSGGVRAAVPSSEVTAADVAKTSFLMGVVVADYETVALTNLFLRVRVAKTGGLFLVQKDPGALLIATGYPCEANTRGLECFSKPQQGDIEAELERVSAFDTYAGFVPSHVMQELYEPQLVDGAWTSQRHRGISRDMDETVTVDGTRHWVKVSPITGPADELITGVDWLLFVVIPQKDYLHMVRERGTVLMATSLGAVGLLMGVLMVLVVLGFVRPIANISSDLGRACNLDLNEVRAETGNAIAEIGDLQSHFLILVTNLRMYRPFLPLTCLPSGGMLDRLEEELAEESEASVLVVEPDLHTPPTPRSPRPLVVERSVSSLDRLAVSATMKHMNVVALCSNVVGFRKAMNTSTLPEDHAEYLDKVLSVIQQWKGVAEPFLGDRLAATWSGVSSLSQQRGVDAALHVAALSFGLCRTVCGLTSGQMLCGVLGTSRMRRHSFIGDVMGRATLLMNLNKAYRTSVLVDDFAHETVALAVNLFFRDRLFRAKTGQRVMIWEVLGVREVEVEEWMYQLEKRDTLDGSVGNKHNSDWIRFLKAERGEVLEGITTDEVLRLISEGVVGNTYCGASPPYTDLE